MVVIGAGLMGNGIAQISLMAGYKVVMVDIADEYLEKGAASIKKGMLKLESKNKLGGKSAADILSMFKTTTDLAEAVKDADIVVEAVVEKMEIKKQVFKTCHENSPEHTILASNTSTMSITEIAKDCGRPEKCIGIHFFNPAPMMKLVEVIAGDKSSAEAMKIGIEWSNTLPCLRGERYIAEVLKDRPGFIANRVMSPTGIYMGYMQDKFAERYNDIPFEDIPWIEFAADFGAGGPMNALVLSDYTGRDTGFHVSNYYSETLSPDYKPGKVLSTQMEKGLLGAKTGRGFFDWSQGRPKLDFTDVKKAGLVEGVVMLMIQANEGCRLLEEKVVLNYTSIDETLKAGFNMPFGPMSVAAQEDNYKTWSQKLEEIAETIGKPYLKPCELMKSGKFRDMA